MEYHRGRLFGHVQLRVRDLEASKRFYRAVVERFYQTALAAGGTDNGAPGERPYHAGYFAAFVLDPDGNNVEAVFHGPARRTAESIVVTPAGE